MNDEPLQPDYVGLCTNCGKEGSLWTSPVAYAECWDCGAGGWWNVKFGCPGCGNYLYFQNPYFCKACFEKANKISLGNKCQLCGRWDELVDGWVMDIDRSEERLLYSAILTEAEQQIYFGDFRHPVKICCRCAAEQDALGKLAKDSESIPFYEGKNVLANFSDRSAMSHLGVLIVRDVLDAAGYETKVSGFEETHGFLKNVTTQDPNESFIRLRSNPDLEVLDKETATVFRIEVKTTAQSPARYTLSSRVVHRLRTYHSDAVLLVYHVPSSRMFVQKVRDIDWDTVPTGGADGDQYYQLQFADGQYFTGLPQVFEKVTESLIDDRMKIMRELFRQYFVGLELSKRYTTDSF